MPISPMSRNLRSRIAWAAVSGALVLGPAAAAIAADGPVAQVVGGGPVADGTYPFAAAILDQYGPPRPDYDRQYCTGSLVHQNWVLTAAHCVEDRGPEGISVTVGRTVLSSNQGERFSVSEIVVHPRWSPSPGNYDVALLHLAGTSRVTPIRLADTRDQAFEADGTVLTGAGWGDIDPGPGYARPDRLQAAPLPVVGPERCYGGIGRNSGWICAGSDWVSDCNGDSGGPLFTTDADGGFVQLGAVSFGPPVCGTPGQPGVFVDLNSAPIRSFVTRVLTTGFVTAPVTATCGAPGAFVSELAKIDGESTQESFEAFGAPSPGAPVAEFCAPAGPR